MSVWHVFVHASLFQKMIFMTLASFSILSWTIYFYYLGMLKMVSLGDHKFSNLFEKERRWQALDNASRKYRKSLFGQVFHAIYRELVQLNRRAVALGQPFTLDPHIDLGVLERTSSATLRHAIAKMSMPLRWLASIANTAPFVGLLGTVVGIVRSFSEIGQTKTASLATVAPGIAEALIMTAFGLAVAIPAVIFYNLSRGHIGQKREETCCFGEHLINRVQKDFLKRSEPVS